MAQIAKQTGTGPSLRAYNPPLRELFGNWIYDTATRAGLPANRMRNEGMFLADLIPGLGDAIGAQEAKTDYQAGNYLGAGLGGLATAMGVIPGAGDAVGKGIRAAEQPIRKTIRAFHGSPHDFDKFSMDKIGTGEGAQAYGHGLYFAENEDVAEDYRRVLANAKRDTTKEDALLRGAGVDNRRLLDAHSFISTGTDPNVVARDFSAWTGVRDTPELRSAFSEIMANKPQGRMYEVEINADPEDFLDWDKPLSEQSRILDQFGYNEAKYPEDWIPDINMTGADLYRLHGGRTSDGARGNGPAAASSVLTGAPRPIRMKDGTILDKSVNIPGIKYMDAGSRGADGGNGTRNFVVFDENLIKIVRKYGIAGAIGAGLLTQEQGEAMAAQGYGSAADDKRTLGDILAHSLGGGGGF